MRATRVLVLLGVCTVVVAGFVPSARAGLTACEQLARSYYGDWFNDSFDSDGPTFIELTVSGRVATFRVDVDGSAFGMMDPPEVMVSGSVDSQGRNISVDQPMVGAFGNINGTIDCTTGDVEFTLTMLPAGFMQVDISGFFFGTSLRLDYSIPMMPTAITGTLIMDVPGIPASDFEDDDENWFASDNAGSKGQRLAVGGNPDAFFQISEADPSLPYKLVAPSIFRGDLSAYDRGSVSFDISPFPSGTIDNEAFGTVTLTGPGGTASRDLVTGPPPSFSFSNFSTSFDATSFGTTQLQWQAILSDVRRLSIEFDAYDGSIESTAIDNVVVPEPLSPAPLALLALGAVVRWRRNRETRAT